MKTVAKVIVSWFSFVVALVVAGILIRVLHLPVPALPGDAGPGLRFALTLVGAMVLVIGLWPVARGLSGAFGTRAIALVSFLLLAFGVNTLIETATFTTLLQGKVAGAAVFYALVALLLGLTLASLFGSAQELPRGDSDQRMRLLRRLTAAWFAFPLIYVGFGMCVAPIVMPYYRSIAFLHVPPMRTILVVQLVRSAIFLACSLPLIALWRGTKVRLWFALGLAHAVVVGLYGLSSSTVLPTTLRVTHSVEICADSFVYAWVLVRLFFANRAALNAEPVQEKASAIPA
ncbi:MAG TPA: hypothetical protein VGS02_05145 [Acidobacteriaceae bacterium]|nr:hypothetical protein [Acidobacteriaceae bacterium]